MTVPQAAFTQFIGARVEALGEGVCRLSLTVGPQHLDRRGALHTGVLTTLLDSSIGIGLGHLRRDEVRRRPHATIEMNASFHAEAHAGDEIEVEGRVIHRGRTIAFGESVARRPSDGETLALSRLTFAISSRPRGADPEPVEGPAHPEVSKDDRSAGPNVAQGPSPEADAAGPNVAQGPSPEQDATA